MAGDAQPVRNIEGKRWLLLFEDAEAGWLIADTEAEARSLFARAEARGWNCHLFEHCRRVKDQA